MYALIHNSQNGSNPTTINMNDKIYNDFILSGYQVLATGDRKTILTLEERVNDEGIDVILEEETN
jgi:hypothetical protein